MCLAIPGKIENLFNQEDPLLKSGDVNFEGVIKRINLAYIDNAKVGDYVIVHAGVAIQNLDEENALLSIKYFREMSEVKINERPNSF